MILSVVILCLAAMLPPSTGKVLEDFYAQSTRKADQQKLIVDRHNTLRRGVKPTASNMMRMTWSPAAAKNAQLWANKCFLSHSPANMRKTNVIYMQCDFIGARDEGKILDINLSTLQCGENLFMSTAPFPWPEVIQAWYNEEKDFEYAIGAKTPDAVIGHFTQVVWSKSVEIGCASAFCPNSRYKYFYVCHYCPVGNVLGSISTPYKKGEPCGDCPNACDNGLCTKL